MSRTGPKPSASIRYREDGSAYCLMTKLRVRLYKETLPNYAIAVLCGMHPYTLSRYVNGRPIKADHLVSICEVLNCNSDDVIGWEEVDLHTNKGDVEDDV
jgi:DNA-binding Xre family transcriptional regulator